MVNSETTQAFHRENILDALEKAELGIGFIVLGGANLVLRDIIGYTGDIDLLVDDEMHTKLSSRPDAVMKNPPYTAIERGARNISVCFDESVYGVPISATRAMGDGFYPISFETQEPYIEYFYGFPLQGLGELINSKQALVRPKDVEHLREIQEATGMQIEIVTPIGDLTRHLY